MSFFLGGNDRAAPVLVKHIARDLLRGVVGDVVCSCLTRTTACVSGRSGPLSASPFEEAGDDWGGGNEMGC